MAFDCSSFFSPDFNVNDWIAEQVGPVPREIILEQLRNDLSRYQAELRNELVSTVNKDYAGFVQVSSRMETFASAIHRFKPSLVSVHDRLMAVHIAVDDKLRQLRELQSKKAAIREAKAVLADFLRGEELVTKLESVLKQLDGSGTGRDAQLDVDTNSSRFFRCGNWFRELSVLQQRRATTPFYMLLAPKIQAARAQFDSKLKTLFITLIRGGSGGDGVASTALEHCLQAFITCGSGSYAESVIITELTQPFIVDTFTSGRLDGTGPRGSFQALPSLLNATLEFVEDRCLSLIAACDKTDAITADSYDSTSDATSSESLSSPQGVDIAGNCLWKLLLDTLQQEAPDVFSCLDANVFHMAYTSLSSFFRRLHAAVRTVAPNSAAALLKYPATQNLVSKWQSRALPVYFGLRFQELTYALGTDCKGTPVKLPSPLPLTIPRPHIDSDTTPSSSSPSPTVQYLSFQASSSLWVGVLKCRDSTVYIPSLAQSFLTAVVQMTGCYCDWLNTTISSVSPSPDVIVACASDCGVLSHAYNTVLLPVMQAALRGESDGDDATREEQQQHQQSIVVLQAVLTQCCDQFRGVGTAALARLQDSLVSQCLPVCASVGSISTTYRMTNKAAPSKPSPFIAKILKPIQDFLRDNGDLLACALPEAASQRYTLLATLSVVTRGYCAAVLELLGTVEKLDASLGWLKASSTTTATAGGGKGGAMSDTDKMNVQVQLDVKAFADILVEIGRWRELGITPDDFPELTALQTKLTSK